MIILFLFSLLFSFLVMRCLHLFLNFRNNKKNLLHNLSQACNIKKNREKYINFAKAVHVDLPRMY